ncbi:NAD(P)H-dependent oxidoreductase [Limosilactobacillus sp. WILCCON 0053]|uniref:NAD(P)H-dependent oxidoreductase n=1 Tax=Limosilactobacillus allomucosae TaxID=3142938 RepID=A0ABV0I4H0_9LACO
MKTLIILAHPHLDTSRVNQKLANAATRIDNIEIRDLYKLYPDFKINVVAEQAALKKADRIVFQFPIYWYSSPALLKQWEDAVLTHGWAYGSTGHQLQNKEFLLSVSVGGGQEHYTRTGLHGYRLAELLRPFQSMAGMVGMKYSRPFITFGARTITDGELQNQADHYVKLLQTVTPLPKFGLLETESDS